MQRKPQLPIAVDVFGGPEPGGTTGLPGVPITDARTGAKLRKMDFEGMIAATEGGRGFIAQTVNGTARAGNNTGGNQDVPYQFPNSARPVGAWKRGNRSGE